MKRLILITCVVCAHGLVILAYLAASKRLDKPRISAESAVVVGSPISPSNSVAKPAQRSTLQLTNIQHRGKLRFTIDGEEVTFEEFKKRSLEEAFTAPWLWEPDWLRKLREEHGWTNGITVTESIK